MATATTLSPASKRFGDFDRYQFEHNPHPVGVDFTKDGFQTSGISFDDYRSMHLEKRKAHIQRRLGTPTWAINNNQLREVVIRFMELRANNGKAITPGTDEQRLVRAQLKQSTHRRALIETIDGLCDQYMAVKNAGDNPARLKFLAAMIENIDTQLRFLGREHLMALGVVFHYYHRGANSVETGAALGLKPPHVRQILWRLAKAAKDVAAPKKRFTAKS